jgi:trigger factor
MEDLEVKSGEALKFSVFVEVVPEFELPSYERVPINKPAVEIKDSDVQDELERQCLRFGTPEPVEGDYIEGDRFICRATATKKGEEEPFFRHDEVLVIHPGDKDGGRGPVLGLLIDGLAGKLAGKRIGDAVDMVVTAPEGHENEKIRGAEIELHVEIKQAMRIAPATIKGVMDEYGMESEDILREQVRLALEQRRDQDVAGAMREQVFQYLLDNVELGLPEKLSEAQVTRGLEAQRFQMLQRGMDPDEVEARLAEIRAESESRTRDRLRLSFILHGLADELKIDVSEQEVNGYVATVAAQRGARPEQLRAELVQSGRIKQVASQLREQKTADRVVALADVSEVTVEEWRKLREDGAAVTKSAPKKKAPAKKTTTKKTAASGKKKTTKKTSKKTTKKTSK